MQSCAEMARRLERAAIKARSELDIPVEAVVSSVATQARAVLGSYAYGWPSLKPETIAHKATGDSPLLETGEMRASVSFHAELSGAGAEGLVYSTDMIAVYQELGTKRGIPPRSFIMQSLVRCEPAVATAFSEFLAQIFL